MPDVTIKFPILVYREEASWVAQCLVTCTTAVAADAHRAYIEVCRLLQVTLDEAYRDAKGDLQKAIDAMLCQAEPELITAFFTKAKPMAGEAPRNIHPSTPGPWLAPEMRVTSRELVCA